jgi:DNA recombination protein Rad52
MLDWERINRDLAQPLDGDLIAQRKGAGGVSLDYIESHAAIQTANDIFGRGNWSFAVRDLQRVWEGTRQTRNGEKPAVAYTAVVCVKVGDVVKEDVGYGDGMGSDLGDATELACKEAVSDAMKRCLRMFGDPFGLVLYEKNKHERASRIKTRKSSAQAKEDGDHMRLRDMLNAAQTVGEIELAWDEVEAELRWLPRSWYVPMRDHRDACIEDIEARGES